MRIADLIRDQDLIDDAVDIAKALPSEAGVALVRRWLGDAVDYGEVG
jgi:hypothetical protein